MLEQIKVTHPDSEYLGRSWSSDPCPMDLLREYGYEDSIRNIVLSDKTESIPSINDWATLKAVYKDLQEEATISFKHDGWNIQISYFNGELVRLQTRGRSHDAISAEVLRSKVPEKIPQLGRVTVVCEATVSNENYKKLKEEINARSQRGAVSSCLARNQYTHMIQLHAFSIVGDTQILNPFPVLTAWGFTTVPWTTVYNYDELITAMKELDALVQAYDYPTDGLVVRSTMTRAVRLLSWEEPIYMSYVMDYDETFGAYRVGIKAKIFPIAMKNSTQRLVSCTNYQRIIDNNLRIGYPIAFRLSSMAIADLDEESTRLLQQQWEGRYEEYRAWIEEKERIKNEM